LNLPPLNEERRRELVKHVHSRLEESRVAVRNVRRDAMKDMKDAVNEKLCSEDDHKRGEIDLEKIVEKQILDIEKVGQLKEAEIMEV
jgi:ribosome recycling factor